MTKPLQLLLVCLVLAFSGYAQTAIPKKLKQYNYLTHPEKLYLMTDRDVYAACDTIWFSAWLVGADNHLPEPFEKIMCVELRGADGQLTAKHLFPLAKGRAYGQLVVPSSTQAGNCTITAYTNFILNGGVDFLFSKNISVSSAFGSGALSETVTVIPIQPSPAKPSGPSSATVEKTELSNRFSFTMFPEGGNLVAGLQSRVAFIGLDENGKGIDIKGRVLDASGQTVTLFETTFGGKGSFNLLPLVGQQYKVEVDRPDGKTQSFPLPPVLPDGHVMSVSNGLNGTINVSLRSTPAAAGAMTLMVVRRGRVVQGYRLSTAEGPVKLAVAKDSLGTGILQFTIFDPTDKPVCERLVYVNNSDHVHLTAETVDNSLILKATDKNGQPVRGDFALSVAQSNCLVDKVGIASYLLLTSELPGLEAECGYFLKTDRASALKADLAMMTNGWRRYNWAQVLADSVAKPLYPMEKDFYVGGALKRTGNKEAVPAGIEVTMMTSGKDVFAGTAKTDSTGSFRINIDPFYDTLQVTVQTKNRLKMAANYDIDFLTNLGYLGRLQRNRVTVAMAKPSVTAEKPATANVDFPIVQPTAWTAPPKQEPDLYKDSASIALKEVDVKAKRVLSPMEKMHELYGPSTYAIGSQQLAMVDGDNSWNYGLISILEKSIPGLSTSLSVREVKNQNVAMIAQGIKLCGCVDRNESFMSEDNYELNYKGDVYRFFFYVDGELCAFTNHGGQLDWMREHFLNIDIKAIDQISVIEKPLQPAVTDAIGASKHDFEIFPSGAALHVLNGCFVGYQPAPEIIINIKTKSGMGLSGAAQANRGIVNAHVFGFTKAKEFYIPPKNNKPENGLKTLFWTPSITTDESGFAKIDLPKGAVDCGYSVTVAGLSNNGLPGQLQMALGEVDAATIDAPKSIELTATADLVDLTVELSNGQACRYAEIFDGKTTHPAPNGKANLSRSLLRTIDSVLVVVPGVGEQKVWSKVLLEGQTTVKMAKGLLPSFQWLSARDLVKKALKQVTDNYPLEVFDTKGVYRQMVFAGNSLVGITDMGYTCRYNLGEAYSRTYSVMTPRAVRLQAPGYKQLVPCEPLNQAPELLPPFDPFGKKLSFLMKDMMDGFDFSIVGEMVYNGRSSTVVGFIPNGSDATAMHMGQLIIDNQTFAVAHAQWQVEPKQRALANRALYLVPGKGDFLLVGDWNTASYGFDGEKWKLRCAVQQVNFTLGGAAFGYDRQTVVTDWPAEKEKQFKRTLLEANRPATEDERKVAYKPLLWRNDKVLSPTQQLIEAGKYLTEVTIWE